VLSPRCTFTPKVEPYPSLTVFDAPEATMCAAQRNRSNTPLQALTTLNDPVFSRTPGSWAGA